MLRLLALGLLLLATAAPRAHADEEVERATRAAVETALADLDASTQAQAEAVRDLTRLGKVAYGPVLAAAMGSREGSPAGDALARAVAELGEERLKRHLTSSVRGERPDRARMDALRVLARFGNPDFLGFAVDLAGDIHPTWLPTPRVGGAWDAAWRQVTAEGPSRRTLVRALEDLPEALQARSARLLAARHDPAALGAVVDVVRSSPEDAAPLLQILARRSPLALHRAEATKAVLGGLSAGRPAVQRAAAALASRMRATGAFDALVESLDVEDPAVRSASLNALRTLTGSAAGRDARAWRRFADREHAWADTLDLSRATDEPALVRMLQDLVRRPFAGGDLAPDVADLLRHEDPRIAILAAAALGRLGRLEVAEDLAVAVDAQEPAVAEAAQAALVRLTGEQHEATTRAWRRALGT